jgi:hypothetical protein
MSLVELGRYDRNLANIIVGRLDAEGLDAIAFDGGASIADGSYLLMRMISPRRGGSSRLLNFEAVLQRCPIIRRSSTARHTAALRNRVVSQLAR